MKIIKKIIIFFLSFSFLFALNLTKEEKEYLQNHKIIKVCINPDWVPIEFRDEKGNPAGISIDILKTLADKLNLKLKFIKTSSWVESQQFLKEKKCDILPTAVMTDKRKKYAIFTKPYLSYKLAVITTNDKPIINNLDEIVDKTMSRKQGSGLIAKMKKLYPNIKIIQSKDFTESFKLVNNGKVYFTIATIPVFEYYRRKYHLNNLGINTYTDFKYNLRIMVRKDRHILRDILDQSLNTISPEIKKEIYKKWAIDVNPEIEYKKYIIIISSVLLTIIFILLYQYYYLRKKIKKATKEIEEKNEKFKKIINKAMEAIIISDEDLKIIDVNKTAEKMFGYKLEEVKDKSLLEFLPVNEQDILKEKNEILEPIELVITIRDGSKIICLLTRTFFIENSKKYRVSMLVDITKFKQQEEMMAQHQNQLH
jgi:PAS domain S-box-containing protein